MMKILFGSQKNKHIILKTNKLREMRSNIFGSTKKSIILTDLTSFELKTIETKN